MLPAGWHVGTVGEIVEIHDSKRIPLSGAQRAKMEKRIYPYYGAASLMDYVDEYIFDMRQFHPNCAESASFTPWLINSQRYSHGVPAV